MSQQNIAHENKSQQNISRSRIQSSHNNNPYTVSLITMLKMKQKKKDNSKSFGQLKKAPSKENTSFYQNVCKTLQDELRKKEQSRVSYIKASSPFITNRITKPK